MNTAWTEQDCQHLASNLLRSSQGSRSALSSAAANVPTSASLLYSLTHFQQTGEVLPPSKISLGRAEEQKVLDQTVSRVSSRNVLRKNFANRRSMMREASDRFLAQRLANECNVNVHCNEITQPAMNFDGFAASASTRGGDTSPKLTSRKPSLTRLSQNFANFSCFLQDTQPQPKPRKPSLTQLSNFVNFHASGLADDSQPVLKSRKPSLTSLCNFSPFEAMSARAVDSMPTLAARKPSGPCLTAFTMEESGPTPSDFLKNNSKNFNFTVSTISANNSSPASALCNLRQNSNFAMIFSSFASDTQPMIAARRPSESALSALTEAHQMAEDANYPATDETMQSESNNPGPDLANNDLKDSHQQHQQLFSRNGASARLRGAEETMRCIATGFYAPLSCQGCRAKLCCIQDADYVLCPQCQHITPMPQPEEKAPEETKAYDGGVGLGFTFEDLFRYQQMRTTQQK